MGPASKFSVRGCRFMQWRLIQDLDRPSAGFIKVSQQPMLDAAANILGFSD